MKLAAKVVLAIAALVYLGGLVRLARLERQGPAHVDLELAGGVPATLYVPSPATPDLFLPEPRPRGERPPAVVLVHGFSTDRVMMSSLARRVAQGGYTVLAIDVRGHGANGNAFPTGRGRVDFLFADLAAAVDFLRTSPYADGSRIVLMGHSMGAGAALDFATRDSAIAGVVPISGGARAEGPYPPRNALFIWAENDPQGLRERVTATAARIAGVDSVELARTYGDVGRGTAVRAVEIPGVDHGTILWSAPAAAEIVAWLDAVAGTKRDAAAAPPLDEPRIGAFLLVIAAASGLLAGAGWASGRLARGLEERPARGAAAGLLALAAALFVAMPLVASGVPASFVPLEVADVIGSLLGIAGAIVLLTLAVRGDPLRMPAWGPALAPAAVGFAVVYLLLAPLGVLGHRVVPVPGRLWPTAALALLVLPFFVAFEALLRRGGPWLATLLGVAGRVLLLVAIVAGVQLGVVPFVVMIMLPALAMLFVLFEIFAAGCYATSGNWLVIALVESAWFAWLTAAMVPVRVGA